MYQPEGMNVRVSNKRNYDDGVKDSLGRHGEKHWVDWRINANYQVIDIDLIKYVTDTAEMSACIMTSARSSFSMGVQHNARSNS